MVAEITLRENGSIYTKPEMDEFIVKICQLQKNESVLIFARHRNSFIIYKGVGHHSSIFLPQQLYEYENLTSPITVIDLIAKTILTQSDDVFNLCHSDLYKDKGMIVELDLSENMLTDSLEKIKEVIQTPLPPIKKEKNQCTIS